MNTWIRRFSVKNPYKACKKHFDLIKEITVDEFVAACSGIHEIKNTDKNQTKIHLFFNRHTNAENLSNAMQMLSQTIKYHDSNPKKNGVPYKYFSSISYKSSSRNIDQRKKHMMWQKKEMEQTLKKMERIDEDDVLVYEDAERMYYDEMEKTNQKNQKDLKDDF